MADIQLKTFEKQRFYKIDDTLARILFALGLAEGITKEPTQPREDTAAPTEPMFSIVMGPQGTALLMLHMPTGERRYSAGRPEDGNLRDAFKVLVWNAAAERHTLQGPEPPKEILKEFHEMKAKLAKAANEAHDIKMQNEAINSRTIAL